MDIFIMWLVGAVVTVIILTYALVAWFDVDLSNSEGGAWVVLVAGSLIWPATLLLLPVVLVCRWVYRRAMIEQKKKQERRWK
jgi:hypothetical protein